MILTAAGSTTGACLTKIGRGLGFVCFVPAKLGRKKTRRENENCRLLFAEFHAFENHALENLVEAERSFDGRQLDLGVEAFVAGAGPRSAG